MYWSFVFLLLYALAYSLHGFFAFLFFAERSESDISFSAGAESYSGSSYYLSFVKESLKESPRRHVVWSLDPQIRSVFSSSYLQSDAAQRLFHDSGIIHVILYVGFNLLFSFGSIYSLRSALRNVRSAVELGFLMPAP